MCSILPFFIIDSSAGFLWFFDMHMHLYIHLHTSLSQNSARQVFKSSPDNNLLLQSIFLLSTYYLGNLKDGTECLLCFKYNH